MNREKWISFFMAMLILFSNFGSLAVSAIEKELQDETMTLGEGVQSNIEISPDSDESEAIQTKDPVVQDFRSKEDQVRLLASNLGQALIFEIEPPSQTAYLTNVSITSSFKIDGQKLTEPILEPYLEIEMPTQLYILGKHNRETSKDRYLDNFNVSAANEIEFIDRTEIREEEGKTIWRLYFTKIDSTMAMTLPYVFSFTDGLVPADFELQPVLGFMKETEL